MRRDRVLERGSADEADPTRMLRVRLVVGVEETAVAECRECAVGRSRSVQDDLPAVRQPHHVDGRTDDVRNVIAPNALEPGAGAVVEASLSAVDRPPAGDEVDRDETAVLQQDETAAGECRAYHPVNRVVTYRASGRHDRDALAARRVRAAVEDGDAIAVDRNDSGHAADRRDKPRAQSIRYVDPRVPDLKIPRDMRRLPRLLDAESDRMAVGGDAGEVRPRELAADRVHERPRAEPHGVVESVADRVVHAVVPDLPAGEEDGAEAVAALDRNRRGRAVRPDGHARPERDLRAADVRSEAGCDGSARAERSERDHGKIGRGG